MKKVVVISVIVVFVICSVVLYNPISDKYKDYANKKQVMAEQEEFEKHIEEKKQIKTNDYFERPGLHNTERKGVAQKK